MATGGVCVQGRVHDYAGEYMRLNRALCGPTKKHRYPLSNRKARKDFYTESDLI